MPAQQSRGAQPPRGYSTLKVDGDKDTKAWVQRAIQKSECSRSIDKLFAATHPKEKIIELKEQMFEQIYLSMGDEVDPEDLERAVVVHYQKFNTIFVVLLSIITLGLFLLFKPRDDDTVLVLTKRDRRVLTIRKERTNFCEGRNSGAVMMFARYLIMLFIILSLPGLLYITVWSTTHPDETEESESIFQSIVEHEDDVLHFYDVRRRKKRLKGWFIALVFLIFAFWLYTNIPRGTHGTRTQMNFSANNIAAAQFTHTGGNFRRRGELRLFFGKYPTQAVLDIAGTLAFGHVAGPVPPSELGGKGWTTPALLTFLTLLLSAITIMDSGFSWADRGVATGNVAFKMQFCRLAPRHPVRGRKYCTKKRCKAWALEHGTDDDFCSYVEWLDQLRDRDDNVMCLADAGSDPPCCSGCEKIAFAEDGWYQIFRKVVSFIGDVGTLVFSYMAAKIALGYTNQTGEVQVIFERRHMLKKQTADVDLVRPLTQLFMESVFGNATERELPSSTDWTDSSTGEDQQYGVRNFEVNNAAEHWDEFIKGHQLVEILKTAPSTLSFKVHVPIKCLGLLPGEEVIAAWGEVPDQVPGPLPYMLSAVGAIQHAVIVTSRRVFSVRVRRRWLIIGKLGKNIRVDVFRHDCDVFFGRLNNNVRNLLFRLAGAKWRPGDVFMQARYGVLAMSRAHGNALNVYNTVWQISKLTKFIEEKDIEEAGVQWKQCTAEAESVLTKKSDKVWSITPEPDDVWVTDADLHLIDEKEKPAFSWSFKERGPALSPFNFNHSVVVTTGRVFVWSRGVYKPFDCRICCCWTVLWCGCLSEVSRAARALFWRERLPSTMSFMTLPSVLSFSTERGIEPPMFCCYDPLHPSWQVPCVEELCTAFTLCLTRQTKCLELDKAQMKKLPGRAGPRTHLWLMWRLKQQAEGQDLEVACHLSPCAMPDDADSDGEDMTNLHELVEKCSITFEEQSRKMRILWKILGAGLRKFDKDRLPV